WRGGWARAAWGTRIGAWWEWVRGSSSSCSRSRRSAGRRRRSISQARPPSKARPAVTTTNARRVRRPRKRRTMRPHTGCGKRAWGSSGLRPEAFADPHLLLHRTLLRAICLVEEAREAQTGNAELAGADGDEPVLVSIVQGRGCGRERPDLLRRPVRLERAIEWRAAVDSGLRRFLALQPSGLQAIDVRSPGPDRLGDQIAVPRRVQIGLDRFRSAI